MTDIAEKISGITSHSSVIFCRLPMGTTFFLSHFQQVPNSINIIAVNQTVAICIEEGKVVDNPSV